MEALLPTKITLPDPIAEVFAGDSHSVAIDRKGKLYSWYFSTLFQILFPLRCHVRGSRCNVVFRGSFPDLYCTDAELHRSDPLRPGAETRYCIVNTPPWLENTAEYPVVDVLL